MASAYISDRRVNDTPATGVREAVAAMRARPACTRNAIRKPNTRDWRPRIRYA